MDVHTQPAYAARPDERSPHNSPLRSHALSSEEVGIALGRWQTSELRLACTFGECRGLARAQLEDIYQDTALVLLKRRYHDEEHLRNALRWGIKHRALHLHRDRRRREQILTQRTPELELALQARQDEQGPELSMLLAQDRLIISEFMTELDPFEQSVFRLMAEGMRYRAIAPVLRVPVNEARKASRSCERKRERFQLLYDTGRLCGYRGHTIRALQAGETASAELAQRAYAHLEACANCRNEHRTNAHRLRRSFQGQAAALLPIPALAGRLGWLARAGQRGRELYQRLTPYGSPPTAGGVRERTIAMLAGGGAAAKIAAGAATVAVLAGGTIGAAHAVHSRHAVPHRAPETAPRTHADAAAPVAPTARSVGGPPPATVQDHAARANAGTPDRSRAPREATGFAFLGVPSVSHPGRASVARVSSTDPHGQRTLEHSAGGETTTGGPFTP